MPGGLSCGQAMFVATKGLRCPLGSNQVGQGVPFSGRNQKRPWKDSIARTDQRDSGG